MRIHLLIISPSRDKLELVKDKLSLGYQLHTARDLAQSQHIISRYTIHAVICVDGTATWSGIDLCRRLKDHSGSAHVPVILVGAEDSLVARIRSLEAGADVYIGGQVFREHLDLQIKTLVANRLKLRRHLAAHAGVAETQAADDRQAVLHQLDECRSVLVQQEKIDVNQLARMMHMSRPTLYRKLKGVTNLTPHELINEARLQKAAELLANGEYRAFQVARMVGFTSPSSFGKSFLKQFKVTPATYQRMKLFAARHGGKSLKTIE